MTTHTLSKILINLSHVTFNIIFVFDHQYPDSNSLSKIQKHSINSRKFSNFLITSKNPLLIFT